MTPIIACRKREVEVAYRNEIPGLVYASKPEKGLTNNPFLSQDVQGESNQWDVRRR